MEFVDIGPLSYPTRGHEHDRSEHRRAGRRVDEDEGGPQRQTDAAAQRQENGVVRSSGAAFGEGGAASGHVGATQASAKTYIEEKAGDGDGDEGGGGHPTHVVSGR